MTKIGMEVAQSVHEDNYRVYNTAIKNLKDHQKVLEERIAQLEEQVELLMVEFHAVPTN